MDDEFLALLAQFSIEETRGLTAGDLDLQLAVRFQREDLEHYRRERRREEPTHISKLSRWPQLDERVDSKHTREFSGYIADKKSSNERIVLRWK